MVLYSLDESLAIDSRRSLIIRVNILVAELTCRLMDLMSANENTKNVNSCLAEDLDDIRQSRQGDSEAYRRLVERHQEYIGQILWRFSRDRQVHEELVQDVFVEAYLSLSSYCGKGPFAHWLSRISTRVGYRYWKRMARQRSAKVFSLQEWDQVSDEEAEQMEAGEAAALVDSVMLQLPPRDRLVLTLRYLEECDVAETARRTGWTKTMVKVQTWRALKKLKKLFSEHGKENIE